jgi:hypothetical protein
MNTPGPFDFNKGIRTMNTSPQTKSKRPPANARRLEAWRYPPKNGAPTRYKITKEDGDVSVIMLGKGNQIIFDALLKQPVYCASPLHISDRVCILRHEYQVSIIKGMYENDAAKDRAKFGGYFLNCRVEHLGDTGGAE